MFRFLFTILFFANVARLSAQLPVGPDTLTVFENGYVQKMPWAGGLNFCQFSQVDLDGDGKKDLVAFDKISSNINGVFRCFLNKGGTGETKYISDASLAKKLPFAYYYAYFFDYNFDGKADLFTYVTGGIQVYKNSSTPGNLSFQLIKYRLKSNYNPTGTPSYGNIPSSGVAVPGIADIDNDGDTDILAFSTTGTQIEYHKNKSKELYGHADSLIFDYADNCWGDIAEGNCQVNLNNCPLKPLYEKAVQETGKTYHAGACIMCFDRDNDGDQDLTLGDISCNSVLYLENSGSAANAHIGDSSSLYPNYQNPSSQIIRLNYFPCTYNLDLDNDGNKDLIASPNLNGSENYKSVWYYKNAGTTTADFQFVKNNFLQDEMIEVGEGAYPVLFDNDADGLLDLVVGNKGYFMTNTLKSQLTYYRNVGSLSQPSYSLITRDFGSISTSTISNRTRIVPAFGDIDSDGDTDMILGDANGDIHWYENTAGAGTTCNFSNLKFDCFNISTSSGNAHPQLVDVNKDGLLDLLIGMLNGRLSYCKNVGTATVPSFSLITNFFGGVNVNTNPSAFLGDGSATPFMFDDGGTYKLLCGSVNGKIFLYNNIDGNLGGTFTKADTSVNYIYEGLYSSVQYLDVNADGKRDLFTGNYCGGLSFHSSKKPIGIAEHFQNAETVAVYPNPASHQITVRLNSSSTGNMLLELIDISGRTLLTKESGTYQTSLDISSVAHGVYFLKVTDYRNSRNSIYKKIIIE